LEKPRRWSCFLIVTCCLRLRASKSVADRVKNTFRCSVYPETAFDCGCHLQVILLWASEGRAGKTWSPGFWNL